MIVRFRLSVPVNIGVSTEARKPMISLKGSPAMRCFYFVILILLGCLVSSCTSETEILHGTSSAAYQEVHHDADGDLFMIATKVFHDDGTVQSYVDYPPIEGGSQMEWELDSRSSVVTVTNTSGIVSEYEYADGELLQVSHDGEEVEIPSQLVFVGSSTSAQERADSVVSASFPGGVASSTERADDISVFYDVITRSGYSPYVYIYPEGGREHFVAYYGGRFLGYETQVLGNRDRLLITFVAAGLVSAQTSWSSGNVIVLFEDYGAIMSTSSARTMVSRFDYPLLLKLYPSYYDMLRSAGSDNYQGRGYVNNEIERELDENKNSSATGRQNWAIDLCSSDGYPADERLYLTTDEATELGYYLFYLDYCSRTNQPCYYDACKAATGMSILNVYEVAAYRNLTPVSACEVASCTLWLAGYPATVDVICQELWDYIDENSHLEEL